MVYCGRPSTGCGNCKSRRIKCDEARPNCQNCIKTNRECPGYPNEVDLLFRKEDPGRRKKTRKLPSSDAKSTSSTPKRSRQELDSHVELNDDRSTKRQRRGTDGGLDGYKSLQWVYIDVRRAGSVPDIKQQTRLSPSIEKQATSFFMNNFVLPPQSRDTAAGFLEVAAPMLEQAKEGSPLSLATEAVAIAVMARPPGPKHLSQHAASLYGRALAATQKAMQDPAHATSDETLLTILLFSLYESMTSSEHSTAAWMKHIEGAVAIVRARGTEQFKNPQSLLLFRAVRTQMLTNALHQRKPIQEFPGPRGWLSDVQESESAAGGLLGTAVAMPNLLNRACTLLCKEKTPDLRAHAEALLHDAIVVQESLSCWEAHMPEEWAHSSPTTSERAIDTTNVDEVEAWPGPMHEYKNVNVSSIRNNTRVNEMLCSSIIMDTLKWLDPENYTDDERYGVAKSRVQSLVDDVCNSVSYHLLDNATNENQSESLQDQSVSDAMGAQYLIWPLYTAMNMRCIPDLQRRWLRGRLLAVARRYGRGMLKRVKGECSNLGRSPSPTPPQDQLNRGEWSFNYDVDASNPRLSPRLEERFDHFDDSNVDPTLLMDGLKGNHLTSNKGLRLDQKRLAAPSAQLEPIPVI